MHSNPTNVTWFSKINEHFNPSSPLHPTRIQKKKKNLKTVVPLPLKARENKNETYSYNLMFTSTKQQWWRKYIPKEIQKQNKTYMHHNKKKYKKPRRKLCPLTLSASQTLTVLSNEDVARRGMLGLKRTSVINEECSSRFVFDFNVSVCHSTACNPEPTEIFFCVIFFYSTAHI